MKPADPRQPKVQTTTSLLARQRAFRGIECPFIEPLVFLSHSEVRLHLQGIAAGQGLSS